MANDNFKLKPLSIEEDLVQAVHDFEAASSVLKALDKRIETAEKEVNRLRAERAKASEAEANQLLKLRKVMKELV